MATDDRQIIAFLASVTTANLAGVTRAVMFPHMIGPLEERHLSRMARQLKRLRADGLVVGTYGESSTKHKLVLKTWAISIAGREALRVAHYPTKSRINRPFACVTDTDRAK